MAKANAAFTESLRDITILTPEVPEADAFETLEKLEAYERSLILPKGAIDRGLLLADYAEGSAEIDDQLAVFNEVRNGVVVSADHATDPVRKATGVREGADHGTAGLARLLSDNGDITSIVPIGRQTGNAATTPEHPVKVVMRKMLRDLNAKGFLSVHGMISGKVLDFTDPSEVHALIGLGKEPTDKTRQVAERLVKVSKDLGLNAFIGNDVRYMTRDANTGEVEVDEDNHPKTGKLAALGAESTTNFARGVLDNQGRDDPAMQIEMTRSLRLLPDDFESGGRWHRDRKALAMGVYTGYLLCSQAVELIASAESK